MCSSICSSQGATHRSLDMCRRTMMPSSCRRQSLGRSKSTASHRLSFSPRTPPQCLLIHSGRGAAPRDSWTPLRATSTRTSKAKGADSRQHNDLQVYIYSGHEMDTPYTWGQALVLQRWCMNLSSKCIPSILSLSSSAIDLLATEQRGLLPTASGLIHVAILVYG